MSPPSVKMDEKTFPASQEAGTPQEARGRGRKWMLAGAVLLAALILGAAVLGAVALYRARLPQQASFEVGVAFPDRQVPEHVTVDYRRRLIYVREERFGELGGLHLLHNFPRGLLAIRDDVHNQCYIARLDQDFDETVKKMGELDGKTTVPRTHSFYLVPSPINGDVLRTFAGEETAVHCGDISSHWLLPRLDAGAESKTPMNRTVEVHCQDGQSFDFDLMQCRVQGHPGALSRVRRGRIRINIANIIKIDISW